MTIDGIHMNPIGNQMMARGVLKTLGLSDDAIAKAREKWLTIPKACDLYLHFQITIQQYEALHAKCASEGKGFENYLEPHLISAP